MNPDQRQPRPVEIPFRADRDPATHVHVIDPPYDWQTSDPDQEHHDRRRS